MPHQLTAVTDRPRLIPLEDAINWLRDASTRYAEGDVAAAAYGVHTAMQHATAAFDRLMQELPYDEEAQR